jgi:hypothetical protein
MDRGKARACGEGHVQGGDVAEADEQLWVGADGGEIEIGQDARASPAAAHREYGLHLPVGEHRVQIGGAVFILAREIAVAVEQVAGGPGLEAHRDDRFLHHIQIEQVVGEARRFHKADDIARAQARRLYVFRRGRFRCHQGSPHARQHHPTVERWTAAQKALPSLR